MFIEIVGLYFMLVELWNFYVVFVKEKVILKKIF